MNDLDAACDVGLALSTLGSDADEPCATNILFKRADLDTAHGLTPTPRAKASA